MDNSDPFANAWSEAEPSSSLAPAATSTAVASVITDDGDGNDREPDAALRDPTAASDASSPAGDSFAIKSHDDGGWAPTSLDESQTLASASVDHHTPPLSPAVQQASDDYGEWGTTHLADKWHDDPIPASSGLPVWSSSPQSADSEKVYPSAKPREQEDEDVWKASARDRLDMDESGSMERTSSQSWLRDVDNHELNEEDRAVLSFAKSAATGVPGNSTHEEPEQQSAMSRLYGQLQVPPAISSSASAFQQSEVYRLAKEAMQATGAAAAGATASLANSAKDAMKPAAPSTGMSSLYASNDDDEGTVNAELFAPVKLPSMPSVNLSALASDISAKSKSMLDYVTGTGEPDLATLESELGVPVRNLDSEAASRASTSSVPTPPASKWSFFSSKKRDSTDIPSSAGSAVMAAVPSRASTSSPPIQADASTKAPTAAPAPARFWRFSGKATGDESANKAQTTSSARSSLDIARRSSDVPAVDSAKAIAGPAKAADLALDDLSALENFDSRRPSAASGTTGASKSATAGITPVPYSSAGMSAGMTHTSSKDSDSMAELDSLPIAGSSRWAFWNRSVPLSPMNGGGRGQHVALGAQGNVTQHEPDIDELFAAFETPPPTGAAKPDEIFDGSLSSIAKAAPQLDGLEDPYARLSIKDATQPKKGESKSAPAVSIDDLDSFLTAPTPIPTVPQPTKAPVVPKPLPLLAPPPSGLRRVSTPKQSLLDEIAPYIPITLLLCEGHTLETPNERKKAGRISSCMVCMPQDVPAYARRPVVEKVCRSINGDVRAFQAIASPKAQALQHTRCAQSHTG